MIAGIKNKTSYLGSFSIVHRFDLALSFLYTKNPSSSLPFTVFGLGFIPFPLITEGSDQISPVFHSEPAVPQSNVPPLDTFSSLFSHFMKILPFWGLSGQDWHNEGKNMEGGRGDLDFSELSDCGLLGFCYIFLLSIWEKLGSAPFLSSLYI